MKKLKEERPQSKRSFMVKDGKECGKGLGTERGM